MPDTALPPAPPPGPAGGQSGRSKTSRKSRLNVITEPPNRVKTGKRDAAETGEPGRGNPPAASAPGRRLARKRMQNPFGAWKGEIRPAAGVGLAAAGHSAQHGDCGFGSKLKTGKRRKRNRTRTEVTPTERLISRRPVRREPHRDLAPKPRPNVLFPGSLRAENASGPCAETPTYACLPSGQRAANPLRDLAPKPRSSSY